MSDSRSSTSSGIWRTWSGTARCEPAWIVRPIDDEEIRQAVRAAAERGLTVRAAGTGHSFNQLACTAGVLLDMSGFTGVLDIDRVAATVTVRAGTRLAEVNAVLARADLALVNMGTLDAQTVVGALSTGNHGTGIAHGPFSSLVVEMSLVAADGSMHTCSAQRNPELFRCARTSLGALGVITTVTLRCVPRFSLRVVPGSERLDSLLDRFDEWVISADHVSFNWHPWRDEVYTRSLCRTGERPTRGSSLRRCLIGLDEVRCGIIGTAGLLRSDAVPWLTRTLGSRGAAKEYVGPSHRVFCFPQPVRFLALEHAVALERTGSALRELRGVLRRFGLYSSYSVLVRVGDAASDPLSPAYGHRTGYLNLTVPRSPRYTEILRLVEHVLRGFGGRPHWGKAHTATAELLRPRYPEWDTFRHMRGHLDPTGLFANDYLDRILGPVSPTAVTSDGAVERAGV